jgi:hypothetical protein
MTIDRKAMEALVVRMQSAFLDMPLLTLTARQAQSRFGEDAVTCEAVLSALADARVLARSPNGAYTRFFPAIATDFGATGFRPISPQPHGSARSSAQHAA